MPDDDRQLLLRTHAGHEPSARELWARLGSALTAHARAIVGPHDAADVVQAVLCRILALPRPEIERVREPRAWLARAVRFEALAHLRTARRENARRAAAQAPDPASPISARDDLQHAIDRLPRRDRELLVLKHVAGLTIDQMALALDLNPNTAASRYRAALESLRTMIGSPAEEPVHA